MNATEAKKLLEPIPHDEFIKNKFTDEVGKCCAIGHLVRLKSDNPNDYSDNNCSDFWGDAPEVNVFVRDDVRRFMYKIHNVYVSLSEVNNFNDINGYNEDNPKDRVIHLLDDMIEAGY